MSEFSSTAKGIPDLRPCSLTFAWLVLISGMARPVAAQTDFYNTDKGRPIEIEDAYPTERYAFEAQLAPVRLERADGGVYNWGLEPELTYGLLPRTHLEIGVPLAFLDGGPLGRRSGIAGLDISVLHNLNVETTSLPAFGVLGELLLPVGGLAPDRTYLSLKGIATRTYGWARFHVNGQYTFGRQPESGAAGSVQPLSRWMAGLAVDKTYPLRSMLVTAELFARRPLPTSEDVELNSAAGIRYQLSPRFAVDAGLGRRLTGDDQGWFVTFGTALAFGIRGLIPVPRP